MHESSLAFSIGQRGQLEKEEEKRKDGRKTHIDFEFRESDGRARRGNADEITDRMRARGEQRADGMVLK